MTKTAATIDNLVAVLVSAFDPLVSSLDEIYGPSQQAGQDTGHEFPSQKDVGIRIFLDSLLRQTHRQIRGEIVSSRTLARIDNVVDRMNNSQEAMRKLEEKYANDKENMFADPEFLRAAGRAEIDENRYEAYNAVHTALASLYHQITGEQWQFTELNTNAAPNRSKTLQDRFKARYAAAE